MFVLLSNPRTNTQVNQLKFCKVLRNLNNMPTKWLSTKTKVMPTRIGHKVGSPWHMIVIGIYALSREYATLPLYVDCKYFLHTKGDRSSSSSSSSIQSIASLYLGSLQVNKHPLMFINMMARWILSRRYTDPTYYCGPKGNIRTVSACGQFGPNQSKSKCFQIPPISLRYLSVFSIDSVTIFHVFFENDRQFACGLQLELVLSQTQPVHL